MPVKELQPESKQTGLASTSDPLYEPRQVKSTLRASPFLYEIGMVIPDTSSLF